MAGIRYLDGVGFKVPVQDLLDVSGRPWNRWGMPRYRTLVDLARSVAQIRKKPPAPSLRTRAEAGTDETGDHRSVHGVRVYAARPHDLVEDPQPIITRKRTGRSELFERG